MKLIKRNKKERVSKKIKKIKKIKNKILLSIALTALVSMVVLGCITSYLNYKTVVNTLEKTLTSVTEVASGTITSKLSEIENVASDMGQLTKFTEEGVTAEEIAKFFQLKIDKYRFLDAYMADKLGNATTTVSKKSINISGEDYFKSSIAGSTFISNPYFKENGDMYFIVSAPLWTGGEHNTTTEGVIVLEVDGKVMSDFVSSVEVGEGGLGFIIDKEGNTIAHPEYERVLKRENVQNVVQTDSSYKRLANIEAKMKSGEINFGSYKMNGSTKLLAYAPIDGTDGWGILINTALANYMQNTVFSIVFTIVLIFLVIIAAVFVGTSISKKIADPITACADRLKKLSDGDFHSEIPEFNSNDETKVLLESLVKTVNMLKAAISDISYHLGAMAEEDLTTTVTMDYLGDLSPIKESITKLNEHNNYIICQIGESAEQIASGSEQVASGAQVLSQGATEQASSVEELAATINEISEQTGKNAKNAEQAKNVSLEAGKAVEEGNKQVIEMNGAIAEINNTSQEIAKIIKAIDDIAFQTNILALNAAVEAARAGSAGKGFAVVADEVRNLASKSAEAAKNTTALIEDSLKAVDKGTSIASRTKESLEMIVEKTSMSVAMIEEIARATEQQSASAAQVTAGVDQISAVVQTDSATSEESAAASEELSSQAQLLKSLIEGIKLKEQKDNLSEA